MYNCSMFWYFLHKMLFFICFKLELIFKQSLSSSCLHFNLAVYILIMRTRWHFTINQQYILNSVISSFQHWWSKRQVGRVWLYKLSCKQLETYLLGFVRLSISRAHENSVITTYCILFQGENPHNWIINCLILKCSTFLISL